MNVAHRSPSANTQLMMLSSQALERAHELSSLDGSTKAPFGRAIPKEHEALAAVAHSYARHTLPYSVAPPDSITTAYPPFLLAGWIWDDLVDHNKRDPRIKTMIADGVALFECIAADPANPHGALQRQLRLASYPEKVKAVGELFADVVRMLHKTSPDYLGRFSLATLRFFRAFEQKVELTHDATNAMLLYSDVRSQAVGMYPCFELAYSIKAERAGAKAARINAYLEGAQIAHCSKLATLHCIAVNDLFSLYKDRMLEDSCNFPALLSPSSSLEGYVEGAYSTLNYARALHRELSKVAQQLAGPQLYRQIVQETWEEMMSGNVHFHFTVPRYAEGAGLVRELVKPSVSRARMAELFRNCFGSHQPDGAQQASGVRVQL